VKVYVIGSLRNPNIPKVGAAVRKLGFEVFDDWHAAGPHADDEWKKYEEKRGRSYAEALEGEAARHVFSFDKEHLDDADIALLVTPAGRSAHLELGYMVGTGKYTIVLHDDPERWDVMYLFAHKVVASLKELEECLLKYEEMMSF